MAEHKNHKAETVSMEAGLPFALSEKYHLLAEFGNDIVFLRNREGIMLYVSPALKRHLGRRPEDHMGKIASELVHPEDLGPVWDDWKKTVFQKKKPYKSRVRLLHKNGKPVWMESLSEPVLDKKGRVVAAVTTSRNIDAQVRAEEEKNRLASIIEESPDEIYLFDPETLKIFHANQAACKKTGFKLAELKNKTICSVKWDCTSRRAKNRLAPLLEGKKKHLLTETKHKTKKGKPYIVETDTYLSHSGDKPVFVYISRDITEIIEAREETRAAQELYKVLAENVHDVVVLRNKEGKIFYVTPSVEKALGFTVEEVLNFPSWAHVHPDDRETIKKQWQENIVKRGRGFNSLVRTMDKVGVYHWFEAYHKPIKNERGEITSIISSTRDVSDQIEAQEKIRLLAENTEDIILLRNRKGEVEYITPSGEKMTGIRFSKAIKEGKTPYDFLHPEDSLRSRKLWAETLLEKGKGYSAEVRIQTIKGDYHWYYATTSPIKDKAGKITGAVTSCKKIHEVKLASEAKEAAEKRFRMLVEQSSDVIMHRDARGKVIYVSPSIEKHLGFKPEVYLGKPTWDHLHPDDKKQIKDWKREVVTEGHTRKSRSRMRHKDGHYVWFDAATEPVRDNNGRVIYSVTTARNITEQIQTETERKRLTAIVKETLNEIFIFDLESGNFTYANPAALKNTGYTIDELKNMNPSHLSALRSYPEIKREMEQLAKGKVKKISFESKNRRKDGTIYDVEITAQMFYGQERPLILVICEDTTEQNKARAEIEQTNQRFRMFAEHGSDILIQRDPEGNVLYASPSLERHLGWKPEEIIGTKIWHMFDKSTKSKIPEWKETVFKKGKSIRLQTWNFTKDGGRVWIESATEPIKDDKGKVIYAISTWRNIDEEKKAEERAFRLASIVEATVNEVFVIDPKTLKFIYVNEAGRHNLGFSEEELKKMGPSDVGAKYSPEEDKAFYDQLKLSGANEVKIEGKHRRKDGTIYDVSLTLQYIKSFGEPVFIAVGEDITEKKKAEELLHQAQKMEVVGHLTGGIAHDFNNLLTAILGSLRLLEQGGIRKDMEEILNLAIHSTKRGADLTHRLLAFARKQHLAPAVVDISDILVNVHALLKGTLGGKIIIDLRKPKENLFVRVDPGELESALLNLGINARDAMPKGGKLKISANAVDVEEAMGTKLDLVPGEYVMTEIADTGTGIDADLLEKVVEPFFTTKEIGQGSGLGLSMVFGFAKQSKGGLEIDSKPGKGTAVRVYLPRVSEGAQ